MAHVGTMQHTIATTTTKPISSSTGWQFVEAKVRIGSSYRVRMGNGEDFVGTIKGIVDATYQLPDGQLWDVYYCRATQDYWMFVPLIDQGRGWRRPEAIWDLDHHELTASATPTPTPTPNYYKAIPTYAYSSTYVPDGLKLYIGQSYPVHVDSGQNVIGTIRGIVETIDQLSLANDPILKAWDIYFCRYPAD
jgi:hypothetical protein